MYFNFYCRRILSTIAAFFLLANSAFAIEPFDSLKNDVNEIIGNAERAGDTLIRSLGEQMLKSIEAMEAAASQLIVEGRDAALVVKGELFQDISRTIDRLEADEQMLMSDLTQQTANWASLIARLPWVDDRPEVMMYRPRVIMADGPLAVPLSVVGPRLAEAEPQMALDGTNLPVNAPTDNALTAMLPRSAFTFPENEPGFGNVTLTFDVAPPPIWWKPWTWGQSEPVERELTFMLLPETVATFQIETLLNTSVQESKDFETKTNAVGKDSNVRRGVPVTELDVAAGWRYDTDAILADHYMHTVIKDRGGSSCTGIAKELLTPTNAIFNHQIGHINGGTFKNDSDGWVDCTVKLPLIRTVNSTMPGPIVEGAVPVSGDVSPDLPTDLSSYSIHLQLFTGQSFILQEGIGVPHGIIEVEHSTSGIHFRPRPPSDF